ncbi:MAG: hypothetical protein ACYSR9_09880 [Planctomycetota bacterium]|jgi:hypothetical protein
MMMSGGLAAAYETTTDKDGYYLIPNQRVKKRVSFFDGLVPEEVRQIVWRPKQKSAVL